MSEPTPTPTQSSPKPFDIFFSKLMRDGSVECPSPKIRYLIYKKLESTQTPFKTEFVGYTVQTEGKRVEDMAGINPKCILKLITQQRVLKSDFPFWALKKADEIENVNKVFDNNADYNERLSILTEWLDGCGYKFWSLLPVYKPIKKITILEQPQT